MSNVKNIYTWCHLSKCSNRRHWRQKKYAAENSSVFRCALKVEMVVELFIIRDRVPDSWCHDAECLGLENWSWSPADRVIFEVSGKLVSLCYTHYITNWVHSLQLRNDALGSNNWLLNHFLITLRWHTFRIWPSSKEARHCCTENLSINKFSDYFNS